MAFSCAGLISGFRLVAVSSDLAKCRDTTQMKDLKSHLKALTSHMLCYLTVSCPNHALRQLQFEVRYLARGMSRDALKSTVPVAGLDDKVVVLKLSKFGGNNTSSAAEFDSLVKFRGNPYLPQVFDYIPRAVAGEGEWQNPCTVLVVESCPTTIDEELHIIVQEPVSLVACQYIEHLVREFLVWMTTQYIVYEMQFKDCHSGNIGLQTTFAAFRAREAEQREYDLQREYARTVIGLKHVDAEAVCDGKGYGRKGLNVELKKFLGCFTYEFAQPKAHGSWSRVSTLYSQHVVACINYHQNSCENTLASSYMNALVQLRAAVATVFGTPGCSIHNCRTGVQMGVVPGTEEPFVPCWGSPARQEESPEREPSVNPPAYCAPLDLPCLPVGVAKQDRFHVNSSVDWRSVKQNSPASLADGFSSRSDSSEHPSLMSLRSAAGVHSPPASYIGTGESLQLPKVRSASIRYDSVPTDRFSSNRVEQRHRLQCSVATSRLMETADCIIRTEKNSSRRGRNASDGVECRRKTRVQYEEEDPRIIEVSATQQESDKINRLISLLFEGLQPFFVATPVTLGRRTRDSQVFRNRNHMVQRWFTWIRDHRGRLSTYADCQMCMWLDMVMAQQLVSWEVAGITSGNKKDKEQRCIPGFGMHEDDKAHVIRSVCIAFVITDASCDERARAEHLDRIRADLRAETK